jgi:hypothetical protein
MLNRYTSALTDIFKRVSDKREAHRHSRAVLGDMAGDPSAVTDILRQHLSRPEALNTRHYPVVAVTVEENPYYTLVMHGWIPLPDGASDVTTKAIHHHGTMLLTSVTAFGPGYEHWTFSRPQPVDPERELYAMRVIEHGPHPLHHCAFVDSYIAHVPLYPPSFTITLALWSGSARTTWKDVLKRLPMVKGREAELRRLAVRVGLARALELKVIDYFDFYPAPGGFKGMKDRVEFDRGPNADYLQSLFHVVQQTGNEALEGIVAGHLDADRAIENAGLVRQLLGSLRQGHRIDGRLSPCHFGISHANFTRAEIERALAAQAPAPAGATVV